MKRLPFALLALSLSVPAVACLSAASDDGEASSDAISDSVAKACNFNYASVATPADQTISAAKSQGLALGSRILLGDFDGDKKIDFATADTTGVQVFAGSGDGHFKAGAKTAIPVADGRTRVALATVAVGDFDADGRKDVVLLDTTVDATNNKRGDFSVVYGQKDGSLAIAGDASALGSVSEGTYYHVAGDLDGDGADDLAYTTLTADAVVFGSTDRKLVAGKTGLGAAPRGLAFIQPAAGTKPAALVIQTTSNVSTLTFDKTTRKPSATTMDSTAIPKADSRFGTDLDSNGQPEITVLGSDGLTIKPVGTQPAFAIGNFPGRAVGAFDLAGTKTNELVYIVNEAQVFAACGYAADAKDLGAVALPIKYGNGTFIAATADINADKQIDFLTVDANGNLAVYLGAGQSTPAPQVNVFSSGHTGGAGDAGDAGDGGDADAEHDGAAGDASSDGGDAAVSDAGGGGHDGGGGGGHRDAGSSPNSGNGQGTEAPPADEGSGLGDPGGDGVQTNPSSGGTDEGTPAVAVIPKPQTVAACSTVPGTTGATTSAFGLGFALMMLAARRRRASK